MSVSRAQRNSFRSRSPIVGSLTRYALVLSDLANFRVVGNPEAIRFDIVEVARSRCLASHLRWAFCGTDRIRPVSGLGFDQTTFDGDAYFILKTRPTQTKYLQCDTLGSGQNGLFA